MGSVVVTWSGQTHDEETRRSLTERITTLARTHDEFFKERAWEPHEIRTYDCVLSEALVDASMFPPQLSSSRLTSAVPGYLSVRNLQVFGTAFSLPTIYPSDNWASFVFMIDEDPAIDGLLVGFDEPAPPSLTVPLNLSYSGSKLTGISLTTDQAREEANSIFKQGKQVLTLPKIHLRYAWEELMDDLLAWIKHFYLPELYYWRYGECPRYQQYAGVERSDALYRDAVFGRLCDLPYYLARSR
jgi:hypothetical protein